jgi:hypothetical protein
VVWGGVIGFAHILTKALFGGREEEERKKTFPSPPNSRADSFNAFLPYYATYFFSLLLSRFVPLSFVSFRTLSCVSFYFFLVSKK